ncbi:DEAD/DEAH box helicase [Gordonia sp. SMJS1]|nr:DEAD/DEAH box helicase [Gordonia sp. SMJS1]WGJ85498.1 DEAD/DEAH box helicase [Gordonia sp. SMJS1]
MGRSERDHIKAIADQVSHAIRQAQTVAAVRGQVTKNSWAAVNDLRKRVHSIGSDDLSAVFVLPLYARDTATLTAIARNEQLPALSRDDREAIAALTGDADTAVHDARVLAGGRRLFLSRGKREAGAQAVAALEQFHAWILESRVGARLGAMSNPVRDVEVHDLGLATADWVGLGAHLAEWGVADLIPGASTTGLSDAITVITRAATTEATARRAAENAGNEVRRAETEKLIREMGVERLKDATRDRLRVTALTDAGITTVWEVMQNGQALEALPGVGATTATRMRGAAQTLWQTTYEEMPTRIDINNRAQHTTNLLAALAQWDATRRHKPTDNELAVAQTLGPLIPKLGSKPERFLAISKDPAHRRGLYADIDALHARHRLIQDSAAPAQDPWEDFLARPADYFAMLAELGFLTEDENKVHGDLSEAIIAAVRNQELDTTHLLASLRGYQSFGARFALVQKKVIIGDEMGLGKTVEALSVLTHLQAKGFHHALVICPAAVVTNWMREVSAKSSLHPHRLHGTTRGAALRQWVRNGGVAVTTFETLAWLSTQTFRTRDIGCVIVDEAHYIKNPGAQRSRRVAALINEVPRTVLLTGTPLENRIDEFRNLVEYLRPDLTVDANELSPRRFRQQVAPAYLRRNQEDVLTELPELVEVDEMLPMSAEDMTAYRSAVGAGNFAAMRQAAMLQGTKSVKVARLLDLVAEAEANQRRVIVFSHFRQVLDDVAHALPGRVFGPLTGSVPAARRQEMVDRFSAAGHGAVLVAQIVAGGVGLNIQSASVVVICEPQLKPTTEWQAIARARRMGQLQSVQVHRLLSEEGVDRRVTDILATKRALFEDFARVSDIADSAPEAFDISEADLAREVVAAERERLLSQPPADDGAETQLAESDA